MSERDIRESKTVEVVGELFGCTLYVDPFKWDEQREEFIKKMRTLFLMPDDEDE